MAKVVFEDPDEGTVTKESERITVTDEGYVKIQVDEDSDESTYHLIPPQNVWRLEMSIQKPSGTGTW